MKNSKSGPQQAHPKFKAFSTFSVALATSVSLVACSAKEPPTEQPSTEVVETPPSTSVEETVDINLDSDGDGLTDLEEINGWVVASGETFVTDPDNPDTDGDGLPDGLEAGELLSGDSTKRIYEGISNPTMKDSDEDGLDDAEEFDSGTDPFKSDSDNDGLSDHQEVHLYGTDPLSPDSDGDGLDDKYEVENREEQGIDPLFADVKIPARQYAADFAKGAFAGDAMPTDSVAWLAGNIAMAGAGFVPIVGTFIGTIADARDMIVAIIKGDWVGVGFSAVGIVPVAGDAAVIPKKVGRFVEKNPHRIAEVGKLIVRSQRVPRPIRAQAARAVIPEWNDLIRNGASENALFQLMDSGRMNLSSIARMMNSPSHVKGPAVPFMKNGPAGEATLATDLAKNGKTPKTQASHSTAGCEAVCNAVSRRFDALIDDVAHESKVGPVFLTESIRKQIMSDAHLAKTGTINSAHWHFYPSDVSNQLGPSPAVVKLLEENGISYSIHLPSKATNRFMQRFN